MPSFADPWASSVLRCGACLLLAAALLLFAGMDCDDQVSRDAYKVPLVVAMRYIVNCLLMVAILAPSQGRALVATRRTGLVLVRAGCLVAASLFMGLALRADAGGRVHRHRVPRADPGGAGRAASSPRRLGALRRHRRRCRLRRRAPDRPPRRRPRADRGRLRALRGRRHRRLHAAVAGPRDSERTIALLFYTALIGSVAFGLALPWFWSGPAPTAWQLVLFLGMGAVGGLGHYLFTLAYRHAPASLLAPVSYLQLFWAGLLGWLVFGDVPDGGERPRHGRRGRLGRDRSPRSRGGSWSGPTFVRLAHQSCKATA